MKMNGYQTYCMYLALKNHFTSKSYDYFKYNGKVSASSQSFLNRKDRFQFEKLARKYDEEELKSYMVDQFLAGRKWVGDMLGKDAEEVHKKRASVRESLSYRFSEDMDKLLDNVEEPKELFKVTENELPFLITSYMAGDISLETLVILNDFVNYIPKFDKALGDDFYIWEEHRNRILKYAPFLKYDRKKLAGILKEKVK